MRIEIDVTINICTLQMFLMATDKFTTKYVQRHNFLMIQSLHMYLTEYPSKKCKKGQLPDVKPPI